ncbi:MAG: ATPase [Peptoniphilaceae bacterium]|nr:ATPase [Peptoniphilaceae bacterium]MDY6019398.1 ATPase [Anaerococcus sp.]
MANINELINEIEDIMDEASSVPFSRKVSVDPDEIYEITKEMRESLPEEIKSAQWVESEKDRILSEAKSEAKSVIDKANNDISTFKEQARNQYQQMVSEHEITMQAKQEANRIIQEAKTEALSIRKQSYDYVDRLFSSSAENFSQLAQSLDKNRRHILEDK